ncbi:MAG TPA: hypothetical protein VFM88_05125 [Vicinamibacteria bacterium]|nr:hypothetical protein [Vicinamibacteria bacterium]
MQKGLVEALHAEGPHPELASELQLFGQFVGSWDVEVIHHFPDGTRDVMSAEWHFGWVLEGRAIQDVWIAPRRGLRSPAGDALGDYGATLRFYDRKLGAWRSTWSGPCKGLVRPFVGRQVGAEIVLEGSFAPGSVTRWIFSAITPDSFRWRNVESWDQWSTQVLHQEMVARRRPR